MELVWFEFEESEKRGEGRSHRSFKYRGSIVWGKCMVLGLKWCDQQQKRYRFCHMVSYNPKINLSERYTLKQILLFCRPRASTLSSLWGFPYGLYRSLMEIDTEVGPRTFENLRAHNFSPSTSAYLTCGPQSCSISHVVSISSIFDCGTPKLWT